MQEDIFPLSLEPNQSVEVVVEYTPQSSAALNGELIISYTSENCEDIIRISLSSPENQVDINVSNSVTICERESTVLQAEGGVAYSWEPAASLDDPTSATPRATPTSTTVYTVQVQDEFGCTGTATVEVVVQAAPVPEIIREGNVLRSSEQGISYEWYRDNELIAGANRQTYALQESGTYRVQVVYANGCDATSEDHVVMTVDVAENILEVPSLQIYPNPAQDILHVRTGKHVQGQILLVNTLGQTVVTQALSTNGLTRIESRNLPAGRYVLILKSGSVYVTENVSIVR